MEQRNSKEFVEFFDSFEKAVQQMLWMNFKYRLAKLQFGVLTGPDDNWGVCEDITKDELEMEFVKTPKNHKELSYDEIRHIRMDTHMHSHWEKIIGIVSVVDTEILQFILHSKIPFEKLIRDELAGRGYDENNRWCGFEKASEIWLK